MYHRRFKNRKGKRIIQGVDYSLTYLGGGSFLYSFPGRVSTVVGRVELGARRNLLVALLLLFIPGLILGWASLTSLSGSGLAVVEGEKSAESAESVLSPAEKEQETEALKFRILSDLAETRSVLKKKAVKSTEYTIQRGDTLSQIAVKFGVPVEMIAASSRIDMYSVIRPGQKLIVPNTPGVVHRFKKNETLAAIMQKYSVKLTDVLEENPYLSDPDLIEPGLRIFLPNAKVPRPRRTWVRPARGRVTSRFGWRRHPIHGYRHRHSGVDIRARYQPIYAARRGQVIYAGWMGGYGKTVIIEHDGHFQTLYAHLSRIKVRKGRYVKGGARIGTTGKTGMVTGPHLHFEMIRKGKLLNPRRYIRFY